MSNNMYHIAKFEYKFNVERNKLDIYHSIQIKCKNYDLYNENGGGNFSLYLSDTYLYLEMDIESKQIMGINGELSSHRICYTALSIPSETKDGLLFLENDESFQAGCGWRIKIDATISYDESKKILKIGDFDIEHEAIRFLKNAYAQTDSTGNLKGLLITDLKL